MAHQERHYVFDDFDTYQEFLSIGETSYRKVFIGEGPKNETLIFSLRSEDKKDFPTALVKRFRVVNAQ